MAIKEVKYGNARYIFKMKVEEEVSGKTKITPSQEEF